MGVSFEIISQMEVFGSQVEGLEAKRPLWKLNGSGWKHMEVGGSYACMWE